MHYTFIVNPNARSGLGYTVWSEIEAVLKARNISYDVYFTKYQRHASQIAQDIAAAMGSRAEVCLIEGATHGMVRYVDPEQYYDALLTFFREQLAENEPS